MSLYYLNITIHVVAALLWLGGMFFLAVVGAPVLRRVEPPELRAELFRRLGEAFRLAGWIAIVVLLVTGVINLRLHGWLDMALSGDAAFWGSRTGRSLLLKLSCVVAMLVLSAIHDFVVGPASSRALAGSAEALRLRRWSAWMARVNAVIGLVLVYAAVLLTRGG